MKHKPESNDDLEMMQHPERWPQWPMLPLKRHDPKGGPPELGILFATNPLTFQHGNVYAEPNIFAKPALKVSPDTLLRDGWRVD